MVEREIQSTKRYIETMRMEGFNISDIDKTLLHMVSTGFFSSVFQIIEHDIDKKTAKELVDAVEVLTKEKTIIRIAHRLKTVRHADQIAVVDKGRIVQLGTHEQLAEQEGIYKRFIDVRTQAVSWKL